MTEHKLQAFRGIKKITSNLLSYLVSVKPFGVRLGPFTLQPSSSRDPNFFLVVAN